MRGRTSLGGGGLGRQRADEETRGWVAGGVDEGAVHRGARRGGEEPGLAAT